MLATRWTEFISDIASVILAGYAEATAPRTLHDARRVTSTNVIESVCLYALACSPQRPA
jgi:hypothetical protein